jgi:hypothetical protein
MPLLASTSVLGASSSATTRDPPYVMLERDRGSQHVVVRDKLGHYEPLMMR